MYVTYADFPTTSNGTIDRGDIFLIEAAINWSTHALSITAGPRKINNDRTQTDQWDPSIAANPSGTELFIGYYSRQNDPVTNSWIMAYGATAYITNGLSKATFDCVPISPTQFQPLFAGTTAVSNEVWTFEPVWPAQGACVNTNDAYIGWYEGGDNYCGGSIFAIFPFGTGNEYIHFCADDYTWSVADSNYFYLAWCDRTRLWKNSRPDADIKLGKVKQ